MTDLVERLRTARRGVAVDPTRDGEIIETFVNPDGPEAAALIERQAAEIDRLNRDCAEWKARWNHHKGKAEIAKSVRNRALDGLDHWRTKAERQSAALRTAREALSLTKEPADDQ